MVQTGTAYELKHVYHRNKETLYNTNILPYYHNIYITYRHHSLGCNDRPCSMFTYTTHTILIHNIQTPLGEQKTPPAHECASFKYESLSINFMGGEGYKLHIIVYRPPECFVT